MWKYFGTMNEVFVIRIQYYSVIDANMVEEWLWVSNAAEKEKHMSEYLAKLKPEEIVKMDVDSISVANLNTVDEDLSLPLHG